MLCPRSVRQKDAVSLPPPCVPAVSPCGIPKKVLCPRRVLRVSPPAVASPRRIRATGDVKRKLLYPRRKRSCAARRSLLLYGRWLHVPASDVARLRLPVARQDLPMFQQPVEVTIEGDLLPGSMRGTAAALPEPGVTEPGAAVSQIEVLLHEVPGELAAGTYSLMVRAEISAESALTAEQREVLGDRPLLQVPAAAVVDHGGTQLVYVQTMAGMFDGRVIVPGVRAGSVYPVLQGLEEGEQVVSTGAFLVDAEARLNPAMAVGYFGADQPALSSTSALAPLLDPISPKATRVLSAADREAASVQQNCPVTGLSLESMGGPVPVQVGDRRVFICCAACERKLLREPGKYLVKLPLGAASETRP